MTKPTSNIAKPDVSELTDFQHTVMSYNMPRRTSQKIAKGIDSLTHQLDVSMLTDLDRHVLDEFYEMQLMEQEIFGKKDEGEFSDDPRYWGALDTFARLQKKTALNRSGFNYEELCQQISELMIPVCEKHDERLKMMLEYFKNRVNVKNIQNNVAELKKARGLSKLEFEVETELSGLETKINGVKSCTYLVGSEQIDLLSDALKVYSDGATMLANNKTYFSCLVDVEKVNSFLKELKRYGVQPDEFKQIKGFKQTEAELRNAGTKTKALDISKRHAIEIAEFRDSLGERLIKEEVYNVVKSEKEIVGTDIGEKIPPERIFYLESLVKEGRLERGDRPSKSGGTDVVYSIR
jgi:hypothetical protein